MIFARRNRSASAWRAMARCIESGRSTSLISTADTLIPQGSVRSSMMVWSCWLIVSRSDRIWSSSCSPTTLRSVLGQHVLDELLAERDKINAILQEIIDEATSPWGIKVSIVEVKDVEIPSGMQRAMARQAEAERERRAKVIAAEGEFQASEKLAAAAAVLGREPTAIQLRYLSTLAEISSEHTNTILFPIPVNVLEGISNWAKASTPRKD